MESRGLENKQLDSDWSDIMDGGANYADFARQLAYDKTDNYGRNSYYASYSTSKERVIDANMIDYNHKLPEDALKGFAKTKFETARKDQTTLFLIDSKNRDRSAFPQPTHFTLYPPRVYKNVTSVQVTQVKLLTSFFYFRAAKGNTFVPIIERGRESINKFIGFPLTKLINLSEGSYGISDLLNNLQIQMNYTPLFYDFPEGFSGFVNAFTTNGDLSVNFNQPGDTYYDALNSKYITNPTMDLITSYYWGSRYAGLTQYSIDQVKVAYYYPVLYEVFLDTKDTEVYPYLDLNIPANILPEGDTVYTHIIFNASGINDQVILYLINLNGALLDKYRLQHTFRYSLINRYQVAYDNNSLRVNFVTLTLNTSLVNLINLTNTRNLTTALQNLGYTPQSYSNTSNALNQAKVVYSDMYNYIQKQLTTYFAIGYATYGSDFFLNTNNIVYTQNGLIASGVRTGYTTEYLTSGQKPIISSVNAYTDSPGYWPNFVPGVGQTQGGLSSEGLNPASSMIPYNVTSSNFQYGLSVIDSNDYYIQTNRSSRSVDAVVTIEPAKYTVFKFRSQTRQTLQVETLPLPYYYRFAEYNKQGLYEGILDANGSNMPQTYFSTPYTFSTIDSLNSLMDSSNYSTIQLNVAASMPFTTALTSSPTYNMNVQSNYVQFEFVAPWPPGNTPSTGLYAYNTNVSFIAQSQVTSNISTNFGTGVSAFIYHDRAAFMADIGTPFFKKENPLHYVASNTGVSSNSDLTIPISTFSGQRYYGIFRSQAKSFGNFNFRPVVYTDSNYVNIQTDYINFDPMSSPYNPSNLTNYPFVSNYNADFLELPVYSTLAGIDPSNPKYAVNTSVQATPIGYDISGVSNDLTDYRSYIGGQNGFVPNSGLRIDPINAYTFQNFTPYDSNAASYFGPESENGILEPVTNLAYNYKGTSSQQIKIVHWYDNYYIPKQTDDDIRETSTIGFSSYPSSIQDYVYGYPINQDGIMELGRGVNAIGFLPTDGLYEVSSFMFKSAIYPLQCISTTAEDPNSKISYIGVFSGGYLAKNSIQISSALTVLSFQQSRVYGPSTLALTPGFGKEKGTWYEFGYDPRFVAASSVKINGYTAGSNELVNYDSMYYMVPFNSAGSNITFSYLTGSLLPYPLTQKVSTGTSYFGQGSTPVPGTAAQDMYIIPSTISNPVAAYGPQGLVSYTQSQYELSQPITTTSIGFREYKYLVANSNALFPFKTTFSNTISTISTGYIGLTTYVSEYSDNLYLVNSLSSFTNISNAPLGFQGASYASSISTSIGTRGGNISSMQFLLNPCTILSNYQYSVMSNYNSTILFEPMSGDDPNITVRKLELNLTADPPVVNVWMWGGGGGAWYGDGASGPSNHTGGAGAYVHAKINIETLQQQYGVSTLYMVVGKGGNRDNYTFSNNSNVQGYEQKRYGAGGTSLIEGATGSITDNITIQGGGFTGIFLDSNLATAQPLLIVGGGGAGGAYTLGGPGGFGVDPVPLPIQTFAFSEANLNTQLYTKIPISNVIDTNSLYMSPDFGGAWTNPAINELSNIYNISQLQVPYLPQHPPYQFAQIGWNLNGPIIPILRNPNGSNLNWAANLYSFSVNFDSEQSFISKFKYWATLNTNNLPSGVIVYSDRDKQKIHYSNTELVVSQIGGIISQQSNLTVYDIPVNATRSNTPYNTSAWVTCGVFQGQNDAIQYSYDGSNWADIRSQTGTPITTVNSVIYANSDSAQAPNYVSAANGGNYWYSCGSNVILRSQNGLDWSSSDISHPYTGTSLNSISFGLNRIVAGGAGGSILFTRDGLNWSNATQDSNYTNDITRIRRVGSNFVAMSPSDPYSIKYSGNGENWSNALSNATGIGSNAVDIAFNDDDNTTYVVATGSGALPLNSPLVYGIGTPSQIPSSWSAVSPNNLSNFTCYTVACGNGTFVAAGSTTDGSSPVKFSTDGINWSDTDVIPVTNTAKFYAFANNVSVDTIHVPGTTIFKNADGSQGLVPIQAMLVRNITFNSNANSFLTSGEGLVSTDFQPPHAVNNNLSIMTSQNGINWTLTFNGGFNNFYNANASNYAASFCGDYGNISVIPNLSTMYVELWCVGDRLQINQFEAFGAIQSILPEANNQANNFSTIYDGNISTYWYPSEAQNSQITTGYNMTLHFSTVISSFSKLSIFVSNDSDRYFTGIVGRSNDTGTFFNKPVIQATEFKYDVISGYSYYDAIIIPALSNVSTLNLTITPATGLSPQINEIRAVNDANQPVTQYIPTAAIDYDGHPYFLAPSNMIDGNLTTAWVSQRDNRNGSIENPAIYKTLFTFSTPVPRINYIRVYNDFIGNQSRRTCITGIVIYTDPSKVSVLYSKISNAPYETIGVPIGLYEVIECNIIPIKSVTQVYIEFFRNYESDNFPVYVNEVQFFNIGLNTDTSAGYTAGTITDMERITLPIYPYDGGGGSNGIGGFGGGYYASIPPTMVASNGLSGNYLQGGSPASAGQAAGMTSYSNILFGAGGGGGGYYGGGGGGIVSYNVSGCNVFEGGGGGGGAGYFVQRANLVTLLDYGVGNPGDIPSNTPSNYIPPARALQNSFISSNIMPAYTNANGYGAGGTSSDSRGRGQHGAIILNFDARVQIQPADPKIVEPKFIDGSALSLFNAPITYYTEKRNLLFGAYTDPIQSSSYSNYNWVWYNTYLSLTGSTLNPLTMDATTRAPSPPTKYPNIPSIVYLSVQEQFSNVSSFFNGQLNTSNTIVGGLQISFELLNQFLITTPYTDSKYVEFTELYCILDYLRNTDNLVNPHVDSITSPLSRIFGGLPGFGYWANPFFTNVSYVGFDVGPSLYAPSSLSRITGASNPVQAFYALVIEQNLSSGTYLLKDVMAYKPSASDVATYGSNWQKATQFTEGYVVRNLTNIYNTSNIPVQPTTLGSIIGGQVSLYNYSVYTTRSVIDGVTVDAPIHMINDFQGQNVYLYSYQNSNLTNVSTIHLTTIPLTSTIIQMNQTNVTSLSNAASNIIGTAVSEYRSGSYLSTSFNAVTQFGFNSASNKPFNPIMNFSQGPGNYYNSYSPNSQISSVLVGKAITDVNGNLYTTDRLGNSVLYENICTVQIYQQPFSNSPLSFASPSHVLGQYQQGNTEPYYDFFVSRYKNIWHLQGTQNLSTIYGARLDSPYDFSITTNFANQIFYPTHKIVLTQKGTSSYPITNTYDLTNYPSYPRTQMFYYKDHTSLVNDISGKFASEKASNFTNSDTNFSGYFFNSFIQNINLQGSTDYNNANADSFNYLAIRAYSPSESFKTLVRFYLPGRFDFGYTSLRDISNEVVTLQANTNVNPKYLAVLGQFTSSFTGSKVFGSTGLPGFTGSTITSVTFGDFLRQYNNINTAIQTYSPPISTVIGTVFQGQKALVTGDLQYIIPSYVANRERVNDPLEFSLPFSTIAQNSNRTIEEYSMGYNLGFAQADTGFNTVQRAGSFFKILDDYIYMKMNTEFNMNRLDISRQENYASTRDTQAESQLYNCKLILNNFGQAATTLIQNPVMFNPPIGKLDKLTFTWYDITGQQINNDECEWSGSIQIVESVDLATPDSTMPKM